MSPNNADNPRGMVFVVNAGSDIPNRHELDVFQEACGAETWSMSTLPHFTVEQIAQLFEILTTDIFVFSEEIRKRDLQEVDGQ